MSERNGMLHYSKEVKQEAVRLFLEEHRTYVEIAKQLEVRKAERTEVWVRKCHQEGEVAFTKPIGRPRKAEQETRELERLHMEVALLKKFHTELRGVRLSQRNIGRFTITRKNAK